jgi:hypothetical protein
MVVEVNRSGRINGFKIHSSPIQDVVGKNTYGESIAIKFLAQV